MAVDSDGKVVAGAVASTSERGPDVAALARYNQDGSLDRSFGSAGKVTDPGSGYILGFVLQPDGRIVLSGNWLTRYRRNGSLDFSFGDDGRVTSRFHAPAVAVQADGKIVAAGGGNWPGDFTVVRFEANGDADYSFGSRGYTYTDIGSNSYDVARSVNFQSDGKIVVAGYTRRTLLDRIDLALVRLLSPAPAKCVVPNVRGSRLAAARKALARRSCTVGRAKRKASTRVKKGRVISQSRRPEMRLPNRSKVNLVVSSGRS
jgi:uncharacterized delta-60 repeat protein